MTIFDYAFVSNGINPPSVDKRTLFYCLQQAKTDDATRLAAKAFLSDKFAALPLATNQAENIEHLTFKPVEPLANNLVTPVNRAETLYQISPVLCTQPVWLDKICLAGCSHSPSHIGMMKVYDWLTRNPEGHFDLIQPRRALLEESGVKIYPTDGYLFSQQAKVLPALMDFAVMQLALSQFPRLFFPEILGFTLAYCQSDTLYEQCFPKQSSHPFFSLHRCHRQCAHPLLQKIIATCLSEPDAQPSGLFQRIAQGFGLFQQQTIASRDQLQNFFNQPWPVEQRLGEIFRQKLPAALGHHRHIQLKGQALDQWFKQLPDRLDDFLAALKQSPYVDLNQPENSRLLTLFSVDGPMPGVLTPSELTLLRSWLTGEKTDQPAIMTTTAPQILSATATSRRRKRYSLRQSYHKLINPARDQTFLAYIKQRVGAQLRLCLFFSQPPFRHFDPAAFESYFQTLYQQEMATYQPLQGKPKISREAYLWGIQQIAPMVLIDGCWLQHCLQLQASHADIGEILFSIYVDELGNGDPTHNHPLIFRRLLDSLSIPLPPVYSKTFAEHPVFIQSAFDLPVFMLSLSQFPRLFLPELLGLNMAIEISGLGRRYLRLVDEWRYWGIDSTIADIHIAIDNVASGHTFLAKQAILLYLDDIQRKSSDPSLVDRHWRRIWTGYSSLRLIGWRFKLQLPSVYFIRKLSC